jgi:sulfur carrier protein
MIVMVNEQRVEVGEQTTVAGLLEQLGFPDRGIAVAMDFAVLPRSGWATKLSDGARLEVLTAVQGG